MSISHLVCCAQNIAVVLFPESRFWIFIILNPIAKILILRDSATWYVQSRLSKTADLLEIPLHLWSKCKGKSSKWAVFDKRLCTYQTTESRKINIFAIGLKIMKIQNLLSRNNTTAMICEQHARQSDRHSFFYKNMCILEWTPWSCWGVEYGDCAGTSFARVGPASDSKTHAVGKNHSLQQLFSSFLPLCLNSSRGRLKSRCTVSRL